MGLAVKVIGRKRVTYEVVYLGDEFQIIPLGRSSLCIAVSKTAAFTILPEGRRRTRLINAYLKEQEEPPQDFTVYHPPKPVVEAPDVTEVVEPVIEEN